MVIEVKRTGDAAPQDTEVKAEVELVDVLPSQVGTNQVVAGSDGG